MKIFEETIKIYRTGGDGNSGHTISEDQWKELRELELHRDQLITIVDRKMQKVIDRL